MSHDINSLIREAKEKYKKVFSVEVLGQCFIFRQLKIIEFRRLTNSILNLTEELEAEEAVCRLCILWPQNYDFLECAAGVPSTLCNTVLESSGYGPSSVKCLEKYRQGLDSFDARMPLIIMKVFRYLSEDDIFNMSNDEALSYYAKAEWALANLDGVQFTYGDDNAQRRIEKDPNKFMDKLDRSLVGDRVDLPEGAKRDMMRTREVIDKKAKIKAIQEAATRKVMGSRT